MFHLTTSDRIYTIQREGLKANAPTNLTKAGGEINFDVYDGKGIYCLLKDQSFNKFKNATDHTLELDLRKEELIADIQSLVDKGAMIDDTRTALYFSHTPDLLIPFDEGEDGISIKDLLNPEHPASKAAIETTGSGVYPGDICPDKIKGIYTHSQYQRADYSGNCVDSFTEEGESLINSINDVTDFAQIEENAEQVNMTDFFKMTKLISDDLELFISDLGADSIKDFEFFYNQERKIALIYNDNADIHGIFEIKETPQINYKASSQPSNSRRFKP